MNSLLQVIAQIEIGINELDIPKPPDPSQTTVADVLSLAFALLGSIAFLIIIVSALRFSLSRGNPDAVSKAKNSIIYSAIGLVIAILAWTIVRFVVRKV